MGACLRRLVDLPTEVVVVFRGLIGTVFILGVPLVAKRRFDAVPVWANIGWLAAGGISLGLNWVLLFAAYRATTVAVASLCNYMAPVILIVVAPPLLGERRSIKKAVCAAVAVLGMVLVSTVILHEPLSIAGWAGAILIIGAAASELLE